MNNCQGNITSVGLMIILLSMSLLSITLLNKFNQIKTNKFVMENYLCFKESDGLNKNHSNFLKKTNTIIKLSNSAQAIGAVSNPAVLAAANRAKKLAQVAQNMKHISFLKNITSLFSRGCIFSPSVAKTHFETVGLLKLKRTMTGLAQKRKSKWSYYSIGKRNLLKVYYSSEKPTSQDIIY